MSFILILFAVIFVYLLANIAFYVAGAYVMMFRTAMNNNLSARVKLEWMWVQTILPVTSLGYVLLVEKNLALRLIFGVSLLACSLGVGYEISKTHDSLMGGLNLLSALASQNNKFAKTLSAPKTHTPPLEQDLIQLKLAGKANPQRMADPLWNRAAQLSKLMLQKFNTTTVPAEKPLFDRLDLMVSQLRWEYVYDDMPPDRFQTLIQALESELNTPPVTEAWDQQWEEQALQAISANRLLKISQQHPELGAMQVGEVEQIVKKEQDQVDSLLPPTDSSNPIVMKAETTMHRLNALKDQDPDSADRKLYSQAWILVGALGKAAVKIGDNPAGATNNQRIGLLIDNLNARLDKGPLTEATLKEWSGLIQMVFPKKQ